MTDLQGRFTAAVMAKAMHEIADRLGVPSRDARLLRMTNNAVFALPGAGLVIRIARMHGHDARAKKVAQLAAWLTEIKAPTIRLAPGVAQPVQARDLAATIWQYVPAAPPPPTIEDLGRVLREFHALGAPPFPVPQWDPVGDARRRLADAEGLASGDLAYLLAWCDRLAPRVAELVDHNSILHGDAHAGNLLRQKDGHILLCDFDPTCLGPWQCDLAPVAVGEQRFGRAGAHQALASAYGYDVTTDPAWPILREARELKMIAAVTPYLASTLGVADEFAIRLRSIIDDDRAAKWTPFAQINTGAPTAPQLRGQES